MEVKGLELFNKVVDKFVSKWDCSARVGTEFAYFYLTNEISWSLLVTEDADKYFQSFLNENFPDITADTFIWSLLHEVGHHETIDDWTPEEQKEFDAKKDFIEELYKAKQDKKISYLYFNLPDEYAATCWAAEYIRENPEEIEALLGELKEVAKVFYKLNEVELAA